MKEDIKFTVYELSIIKDAINSEVSHLITSISNRLEGDEYNWLYELFSKRLADYNSLFHKIEDYVIGDL